MIVESLPCLRSRVKDTTSADECWIKSTTVISPESHCCDIRTSYANHVTPSIPLGTMYWHGVQLRSDSPFSARKILIPDGSYRGRQAIIIEPEEQETQKLKPVYAKHSMFMDLPVELRLKVYKMLFEASNPVILRSERPPTFASTPSQFFSQKSLAIANVCRQIRFEVLPVIYGERTFCIDSPYVPDLVVENFLVNIGSSRKYLRFLDVGRYADSHWSRPDMFHRLLTCPNLQHVHFRVHAIGKTPEKYAEFFYKSARLWLNMRLQNNEKKRSGLEIVTFSNLPIGWHGGEWNENGGERLKIMIRELMDGDSS